MKCFAYLCTKLRRFGNGFIIFKEIFFSFGGRFELSAVLISMRLSNYMDHIPRAEADSLRMDCGRGQPEILNISIDRNGKQIEN